MARLFIAAVCFMLIAKSASAAQPIYKTMVECGAVYAASAELVRSKSKKHALNTTAKLWRDAAISAVAAARMPEAPRYVAMMYDEKLRQWRGKGRHATLGRDFHDQTSNCQSLAGAQGLDLIAKKAIFVIDQ